MAWKGDSDDDICCGMPHKAICPLLKQWRQVAKGKTTVESAETGVEMVKFLRAAVSAVPGGSTRAESSAVEVWSWLQQAGLERSA